MTMHTGTGDKDGGDGVDPPRALQEQDPRESARVESIFFAPDGRLRRIPAREKQKLVVMARVAGLFERGRDYSDAEVRSVLSAVNEDHALIRRFLVDHGMLVRDARGTRYRRP